MENRSSAKTQLAEKYKVEINPIGVSSYSKVYKATSLVENSHKVAVKVVNKEKAGVKRLGEAEFLLKLDHPNIIKLFDTFEDDTYLI
jgi:serine/threonine protein kinase